MYKTVERCRCCDSDQLVKYLDLGSQPLANSYHKGESLDHFPLEVNLCQECYHSQLSIVVDPPLMFKNYLYVSGTTETFRTHCKKLAKSAISHLHNVPRPKVLDIACNDGTLLGYFRDFGCDVYGVDPAENLRDITLEKEIQVLVDYWSIDAAAKLGQKFDVVTGTNVFAHVDDINGFLEAAHEVLTDSGVLILEFPYCENMIGHNEFDTIYHEHLSYFLVNSFVTVAHRVGFTISDIVHTPIHGGSIRFFCQKMPMFETRRVYELTRAEEEMGLHKVSAYLNFAKRVDKTKSQTRDSLNTLRQAGEKVIGYAASAKGNTMLNYFGLDLDYIVDDNPLKWDYLTPGRNIPIRPTDALTDEVDNLNIVILAWNFYDEIKKRILAKRGKKGSCCVLYVPEFKMELLDA